MLNDWRLDEEGLALVEGDELADGVFGAASADGGRTGDEDIGIVGDEAVAQDACCAAIGAPSRMVDGETHREGGKGTAPFARGIAKQQVAVATLHNEGKDLGESVSAFWTA